MLVVLYLCIYNCIITYLLYFVLCYVILGFIFEPLWPSHAFAIAVTQCGLLYLSAEGVCRSSTVLYCTKALPINLSFATTSTKGTVAACFIFLLYEWSIQKLLVFDLGSQFHAVSRQDYFGGAQSLPLMVVLNSLVFLVPNRE